jgi:hypothetical protein
MSQQKALMHSLCMPAVLQPVSRNRTQGQATHLASNIASQHQVQAILQQQQQRWQQQYAHQLE